MSTPRTKSGRVGRVDYLFWPNIPGMPRRRSGCQLHVRFYNASKTEQEAVLNLFREYNVPIVHGSQKGPPGENFAHSPMTGTWHQGITIRDLLSDRKAVATWMEKTIAEHTDD